MPDKLHLLRHASALKIAASLRRIERAAKHHPEILAAVQEHHVALADAVTAHGAELGLGGIEQYSGGIPK